MDIAGSKKSHTGQRFKNLTDAIPQQVWTAEPDGQLSYVNSRVTEYFGIPLNDVLGSGWHSLIHPDDLPLAIEKWTVALASGKPYDINFRLKRWDGKYLWHIGKALPMHDSDGRIIEWFGTNTDISERGKDEKELRRLSKLLEESQQIAQVGGWELDVATGDLFWTEETYRLHDTSPEEFNPTVDAGVGYFLPESRETILAALDEAITNGKDYDLELETYTTKGRKIDVRTTCRITRENGKTVKLTGIFQDISEQKKVLRELENANSRLAQANDELVYIAHYDALTRLPNRTLLADRMQQAMINNKRRGTSVAVAFLDLDGFKDVNDTHGHEVGDTLLVHLAHRMRDALRAEDTLARIGGDEFVVVLADLASRADCEHLLARVLKAAAKPTAWDGRSIQVTASIGVTIYPQDGVDADQLLRHADQAMYVAKQAGKNCIHYFDVAKDARVKTLHEELEAIRTALEQEQFVLFYQPKVNMQTGKVIGAEALIRWMHPERGMLPPAHFLPIIEEDQLSVEIGEWVFRSAMQQMDTWQKVGLDIPVSVNVGALQLRQLDFTARLKSILKQFPHIHPSNLELEIIETSALGDITQVSSVIKSSKKLGVSFSLDDFGTGYSSLTYLKRLPTEILKIDQSFVRDMLDDPEDMVIIKGIISLAKAFGRIVIAEGVETVEQGRALLSCGCILAQGYGIARPMAAKDLPEWAKTWKSDITWQNTLSLSGD